MLYSSSEHAAEDRVSDVAVRNEVALFIPAGKTAAPILLHADLHVMLLTALELAGLHRGGGVGVRRQVGFLDPAHRQPLAAPLGLPLLDVVFVSAGEGAGTDQGRNVGI